MAFLGGPLDGADFSGRSFDFVQMPGGDLEFRLSVEDSGITEFPFLVVRPFHKGAPRYSNRRRQYKALYRPSPLGLLYVRSVL